MTAYELRVTQRALDDLELDPDLGKLPASVYRDEHAVIDGFVAMRSQYPEGQEATVLPVTSAIVYNLHVGRYRGLTWFDRNRSVVWLLGVGWHESGSRDDAYAVLKARDQAGELFPTASDYLNLVPSAERFARELPQKARASLQAAMDEPGEEIVADIAGVLGVSVFADCVAVDESQVCEIFVSLHRPPKASGVLPDGWEMAALAAFAPVDALDEVDYHGDFPRHGPPPSGVHSETVFSYVVHPPPST